MEIEINVFAKQDDLKPSELSRVRRTINVLCDVGFDVTLHFQDAGNHNDKDEYGTKYAGGKYPHSGYFIKMVKDTNQRLDKPTFAK